MNLLNLPGAQEGWVIQTSGESEAAESIEMESLKDLLQKGD